jgi:hypothetical protein
MTSPDYLSRTEQNVLDSDGTLIISMVPKLSHSSALTATLAVKHRKPWIHIHAGTAEPSATLKSFVKANNISVLNVAGRAHRASRKLPSSSTRFSMARLIRLKFSRRERIDWQCGWNRRSAELR